MNALEVNGHSQPLRDFRLQNVSFTLPMGCALGLVGENGAGKSTTISLLLGLLERDGGTVRVLGHEPGADFEAVKEDIGVVFDEAAFPDGVNARQVDRIERCLYRNWDSAAYFGHLRRYDLPETKRFKDFSRGMKMKLALAVALSHGAKLLLLDEATGGLDPFARDELLRELEDFIADGSTPCCSRRTSSATSKSSAAAWYSCTRDMCCSTRRRMRCSRRIRKKRWRISSSA